MPFQIIRNDITKMEVDAIVNTASPHVEYGPGIDKAVYEAAGVEELMAKRKEIGEIPRGSSVITEGFNLPAKYIIHTVGIAWKGGNDNEEEILRSCYRTVFQVAEQNNIESLAIPLLASGNYGFPKGIAIRIALSEIEAFMVDSDMDLYLVVFDDKAFSLSSELYGDIETYISENYVDEKTQDEYPDDFWDHHERGTVVLGASVGGASLLNPLGAVASKKAQKKEQKRLEELRKEEEKRRASERSLDDVIGNLDKTFMEMVFSFADEKGMSDVEVQRKANLDRKAFSKLKCGTTKTPRKSTALALAIALELNLDETKDLLSRAGLALSPCSKQDVIVKYFIEREAYDIFEINFVLDEHGEECLGSLMQ